MSSVTMIYGNIFQLLIAKQIPNDKLISMIDYRIDYIIMDKKKNDSQFHLIQQFTNN